MAPLSEEARGTPRRLRPFRGPARTVALAALAYGILAALSSPVLAGAASGVGAAVAWSLRGRLAAAGLRAPAVALIAALAVVFQAWLVTQGSFALDVPEPLGGAYDSLAHHLRHGSAEVDSEAIQVEAWRSEGRTFMYFGPWPALLRGVLGGVNPGWDGLWSRFSTLTAVLLALWAAAGITVDALARNRSLTAAQRGALALTTLAAFALGSPMLVLGSLGYLYHEAIAWGLCGALWGLRCALRILDGDARPLAWTAGLAAAAGVALLSRLSFGAPLVAMLGLLVARQLWRTRVDRAGLLREAGRLGLVIVPAVAALAVQAWYNHARFDSVLSFADWSMYRGQARPGLQSAVDPRRLVRGIPAYLGIGPGNFSAHAPYLVFRSVRSAHPVMPHLDNARAAIMISPLLTAPWVLLGLSMLRRVRSWDRWRIACFLCLAAEAALICGYYWIGYRYVVEFLPLILALHATWLVSLGGTGGSPRGSAWALAALTALAVVATGLSALDFQRRWSGYPQEHRVRIAALLERADGALGTAASPRKRGGRPVASESP